MLLVVTLVVSACAAAGEQLTDGSASDACVESAEICNGRDDDCDTIIDEGFDDLGAACMVGTGACTASGRYVCNPSGTATICDATSGTPEGELCNGLDDDCDGATDEGLNVGADCDGQDADACNEGHIVCVNNAAVCDDTTGTNAELCNGLDDDCQLGVDDLWPVGQSCTVGVGACAAAGTLQCDTASSVACNATAGAPTAELCGDGIDQDCDGGDPVCPSNDTPPGAIDISAGGTFTTDLSSAHDNHTVGTCGLPANGGRDVYYRFYLPAAEVIYVDTFGSNFDSVLRLYSGTCTSIASEVVCRDDSCGSLQSQQAMQLAAGNYCLIVDQYGNGQTNGALTLHFTRGGRTGIAIAAASGSQSGTTTGVSNQTTPSACGTFNHTAPDDGYFFTMCPADSRVVSANTCTATTWDSVVYLRTGNAQNADTACNDDSCALESSFTNASIAGANLYWLVVDGYQAASGAYTLSYTM
jgi:hypothetical protein